MGLGVLLIGATGWLVARIVVLPRLHFESHLQHIEHYGFQREVSDDLSLAEAPRSWLNASLNALAERLGNAIKRVAPYVPSLARSDLTAAGYYDMTPEAVQGYRAMAAVVVGGLGIFYVVAGSNVSAILVLLFALLTLSAWMLPATFIRVEGRSRLNKIDRDLPQFLDLVTTTVEAGIGFGGAMTGVAVKFQGPLGDELRITMQQQNLGISTERALTDMAARCQTASVRSFTRAVIRAESHGVSIGPVLRHLALEIRQRRRDEAREKIQKAPVKMLIPIVIFILFPLLLVIMYPAMYNILHVLSHV
jgi:tight adherence protein C